MAVTLISDLKNAISNSARPNLFECEIQFPTNLASVGIASTEANDSFKFLCKAAAIPSMTIGVVEIPFRGRRVKVPGDRVFDTWTATVMVDEQHFVRRAFKEWVNTISTFDYETEGNRPVGGSLDDYMADVIIRHFKQDGTTARTYKLFDAFPTDIDALDLSFDAGDTLSEFGVTFQYHYLTAKSGVDDVTSDDDLSA